MYHGTSMSFNTCPVGVCTQRDDLRAKLQKAHQKKRFNFFTHVAEEVREILAALGFTHLKDVIGRTDLLSQVSRGDAALDDLDLNPIWCRLNRRQQVIKVVKAVLRCQTRLMRKW